MVIYYSSHRSLIQMAKIHGKMPSTSLIIRETLQCDTTTHQTEWLILKRVINWYTNFSGEKSNL